MIRRGGWLLLAGLALAGGCASTPDAPVIDDPAFVEAAGAVCSERLPPLRADIGDDTPREPDEVAPVVEDRAAGLDRMVDELEELSAVPGARPEISSWLEDWRTYVAVGRRYAEALRDDDPESYSEVAAEGAEPQARISAFARANGMEECALDGAPLPERESPI